MAGMQTATSITCGRRGEIVPKYCRYLAVVIHDMQASLSGHGHLCNVKRFLKPAKKQSKANWRRA